jgi:mannose-6-phosphate isomerase-like protein (cupin superfamily)
MAYRFVDWNDIEPYGGTLRRIRRELGITAFGVNLHEMPSHADDYPDHSETETDNEELYICLSGGGVISVDGEEIELKCGRCVFVSPESRRKIVAGPEGLSCLAIGAPAGSHRGWENL